MRDLFFTFLIAFSASIISFFLKPIVHPPSTSPTVLPAQTTRIITTPAITTYVPTPTTITSGSGQKQTTSTTPSAASTTPASTSTAPNPITPTNTPAPSYVPTPNPSPTQAPSSQDHAITTDTKSDYILGKINGYRTGKGLSKVENDSYTCDFAKKRAKEITTKFNHDGFESNLPYPGYSLIAENIAQNSDYKKVADSWIASSGHRENLEKDVPYGCVGNEGNYFAYEAWKP